MTVQFKHFRNRVWDYGTCSVEIDPRGGVTIAYVEGDGTSPIGIALCSAKDGYNKKIGRELATKRLQESPYIISNDELEWILQDDSVDSLTYDCYFAKAADHFKLFHILDRAILG